MLMSGSDCFWCTNRAGKPPPGLHLDVMKDEKMIQVSLFDILFVLGLCIYVVYSYEETHDR